MKNSNLPLKPPDFSRQLQLLISQRLGNPIWIGSQSEIRSRLLEHGSIVIGMGPTGSPRRRIQDCDAVLTEFIKVNGHVPDTGLIHGSFAIFRPHSLLLHANKLCDYCFVREDLKQQLTVEVAIQVIQQNAGSLDSPLKDAVLVLTEEVQRLRAHLNEPPEPNSLRDAALSKKQGRNTTPKVAATAVTVTEMTDVEFFDYFAKVKEIEGGPSIADLKNQFAAWLTRQAGRKFDSGTIEQQRDAKRAFANQVREIANYLHCKFRIVATGETGNLRYVRSGRSQVGQFRIERVRDGVTQPLLVSKDFPALAIA